MNTPDPAQIFSIDNPTAFEQVALTVFRHQAEHCAVYRDYIHYLNIDPASINSYLQIPFLPISFFKSHEVVSTADQPEIVFSSSGTTGQSTSKHLVSDVKIYEQSFNLAFEQFYGNPQDICILALLPSYLEREGSSLIYMVDDLLKQSQHPQSGYFLHDLEALYQTLLTVKASGQKTILIGVTYALLDFVESFQLDFPELIVMETGGMKGKRKEMVREELHQILTAGFGVSNIHSEYGMTELLSQGYSYGDGIFNCPPWMKILLRDTSDPLSLLAGKQSGGINVIDLANLNSCAFIATQDLGKVYPDGSFEVLGRFDNADIRGCNLLVQ
ncbi:acyl transferase [Pedobacter sp. KR3-3]|uniref:Acyl transferase n=1 Tax=Pedobacter albus TaxID=3113905 RepID=A0ABU7I6J8_9SPHI|nr:acyl transferase [Pedobacter sp. KR3-3]MEE1945092.1 acyl transferase [Pedobacter sp. KR3-3]